MINIFRNQDDNTIYWKNKNRYHCFAGFNHKFCGRLHQQKRIILILFWLIGLFGQKLGHSPIVILNDNLKKKQTRRPHLEWFPVNVIYGEVIGGCNLPRGLLRNIILPVPGFWAARSTPIIRSVFSGASLWTSSMGRHKEVRNIPHQRVAGVWDLDNSPVWNLSCKNQNLALLERTTGSHLSSV